MMPKAPITRFDLSIMLESDENDAEDSAEVKNILQESFEIGEGDLELTRTEFRSTESLYRTICGHCAKKVYVCMHGDRQACYFSEDESDDEEKFASRDVEEEE